MITTILIFVAVLAVLVLAHEFGHFIVAKRAGCRVDEFGFGFPPRLFGWRRGETLYSVNLLPLGGFVKIKGEQGEDEQDSDSFAHKPARTRLAILAAGVAMNLLVAIVLMQIVMGIGARRIIDERVTASARVRDHKIEVVNVLPDSPAAQAGVQTGDLLLSVEGLQGQASVTSLRDALQNQPRMVRKVVFQRGSETKEYNIAAYKIPEINQYGFGVALLETGIVSYPWYVAPWKGITETWFIAAETFKSFGNLIAGLVRGQPVGAQLAGPVGIAVLTREVASLGLIQLMQFIALLSVNLAIINFLPIPALDGGRALFVVIEKIRGRKVRAQLEAVVHMIGFVVLLGLIILVTYRDIVRIISH